MCLIDWRPAPHLCDVSCWELYPYSVRSVGCSDKPGVAREDLGGGCPAGC